MGFEACRNPSVGFADSSPASGGAFNSLSQTFGLPAPSQREPFGQSLNSYVKPPSLREVDRLSYEVQQWKKDSMGTRV